MCNCITADQTPLTSLPHFHMGVFRIRRLAFMIILGSTENSHHFFSGSESPRHIHYNQHAVHYAPFLLTQILMEKGAYNCIKTQKNMRKNVCLVSVYYLLYGATSYSLYGALTSPATGFLAPWIRYSYGQLTASSLFMLCLFSSSDYVSPLSGSFACQLTASSFFASSAFCFPVHGVLTLRAKLFSKTLTACKARFSPAHGVFTLPDAFIYLWSMPSCFSITSLKESFAVKFLLQNPAGMFLSCWICWWCILVYKFEPSQSP